MLCARPDRPRTFASGGRASFMSVATASSAGTLLSSTVTFPPPRRFLFHVNCREAPKETAAKRESETPG